MGVMRSSVAMSWTWPAPRAREDTLERRGRDVGGLQPAPNRWKMLDDHEDRSQATDPAPRFDHLVAGSVGCKDASCCAFLSFLSND